MCARGAYRQQGWLEAGYRSVCTVCSLQWGVWALAARRYKRLRKVRKESLQMRVESAAFIYTNGTAPYTVATAPHDTLQRHNLVDTTAQHRRARTRVPRPAARSIRSISPRDVLRGSRDVQGHLCRGHVSAVPGHTVTDRGHEIERNKVERRDTQYAKGRCTGSLDTTLYDTSLHAAPSL